MQAYMGHGSLLLLAVMLFFLVPCFEAVCRHCHGTIPGCRGGPDNDQCTSFTGVASNVAALAAGATTALSCAHLLPTYLLRVFTRRVFDVLTALARRGSSIAQYAFAGKSPDEIIRAVADRQADAEEAITELGVTAASSASEAISRQCLAAIRVVDTIKERVGQVGSRLEYGRFLYIFGIVQQYVATSVCDGLSLVDPDADPSSAAKLPTVKIRAPSSIDAFYESLTL